VGFELGIQSIIAIEESDSTNFHLIEFWKKIDSIGPAKWFYLNITYFLLRESFVKTFACLRINFLKTEDYTFAIGKLIYN